MNFVESICKAVLVRFHVIIIFLHSWMGENPRTSLMLVVNCLPFIHWGLPLFLQIFFSAVASRLQVLQVRYIRHSQPEQRSAQRPHRPWKRKPRHVWIPKHLRCQNPLIDSSGINILIPTLKLVNCKLRSAYLREILYIDTVSAISWETIFKTPQGLNISTPSSPIKFTRKNLVCTTYTSKRDVCSIFYAIKKKKLMNNLPCPLVSSQALCYITSRDMH